MRPNGIRGAINNLYDDYCYYYHYYYYYYNPSVDPKQRIFYFKGLGYRNQYIHSVWYI